MKLSFRQGIVRRQTNLTAPAFLRKTGLNATTVDLVVSPEPTVVTFAHYSADYLIQETQTVIGAWGSGAVGSTNGPMQPGGQTQYLFWDIDLASGQLTRGWTLVPPIVSANEPTNPVLDTHWFDMTTKRMRVLRKSNPNAAAAWIDKIRVFAGVYDSNGNVIPYDIGSQVGIKDGNYASGNLMLGVNTRPLKQSDGTFLTTETALTVYQTTGQNVQFDATLVWCRATEEIAKFHLVSFQPGLCIGLASSNNMYSFVSGLVIEDLHQDEVGQVITNGVIRNEQWSWEDDQINKPLFCGVYGEIKLTPPLVGVVQQIGYVYDKNSIYLNLFPPVRLR